MFNSNRPHDATPNDPTLDFPSSSKTAAAITAIVPVSTAVYGVRMFVNRNHRGLIAGAIVATALVLRVDGASLGLASGLDEKTIVSVKSAEPAAERQPEKLKDGAKMLPNFSGLLYSAKMPHREGNAPLLAILWDPHRPGNPAPQAQDLDRLLFGPGPSVAGWLSENSGGRFSIVRAAPLEWFDALKPADHYWGSDPGDSDGDGFVTGHVEKWAEAVRHADKTVDFASFDTSGDKVLQSTELAVLVVIPQSSTFGTMRSPQGRELPTSQPLVVDGVTIPAITEAYVGAPVNLGVLCHELSHLLLGAPDMYFTSPWPYAAGDYSIMDRSYSTTHLDPFEKLKLGWLKPRVVNATGEYSLDEIESTQDCIILHEVTRQGQEYFILENRWRAKSYDAGVEQAGAGLRQDGLAIWHVIEDPAVFDTLDIPGVAPGDWGRRSIRLIRVTGPDAAADDGNALFTKPGTLINGTSSPARLDYVDKKPAPFSVELLSEPGPVIRVRITR